MIIKCNGRKKNILRLLDSLKESAQCIVDVSVPEAFDYCGLMDFVDLKVEILGNFVDFNIFRKQTFKNIRVQLISDSFELVKKAGSFTFNRVIENKVTLIHKPTNSVLTNLDTHDVVGTTLSEYDTLELYERKIERDGVLHYN